MNTGNDTVIELLKSRRKELIANRETIDNSIRDTDGLLVQYASGQTEGNDSYRTVTDSLTALRDELRVNREVLDRGVRDVEAMAAQYVPAKANVTAAATIDLVDSRNARTAFRPTREAAEPTKAAANS